MLKRFELFVLSVCLFLFSLLAAAGENIGAVAAGHPLATAAGIRVLEKGGNAFDAAIAVASTLNVVEPMMSGVGGYGSILVFDASKGSIRYLNGNGKIPELTNSDLMRPPTEAYLRNRIGAKSVSTPSNAGAWYELHASYGTRPWKELFSDAIGHAERGYALSTFASKIIAEQYVKFSDEARKIYGDGRRPLPPGSVLVQADLGATLRKIAQNGPGVLYQGDIASKIDAQMKMEGGFLTRKDLAREKPEWRAPVSIPYKGYEVYTIGFSGNGFTSLLAMGTVEKFNFSDAQQGSPVYFEKLAEVLKKSMEIRRTFPGTVAGAATIENQVLSDANFLKIAKDIDLDRVSKVPLYPGVEHENTTHFVVADRWGNIVSATQTLGDVFGSKILVQGTGIWLNNSLSFSTFEPKGNPMDPVAGESKLSSNAPILILRDKRPWAALGTPGGHTIPQNVAQISMNLIDKDMTMQRAIDAPKIAYIEDEDLLRVEEDMPEQVRSSLERKGHRLKIGPIGNAMGIRFRPTPDGVSYDVGIDHRRDWQTSISNN